MKRIVYLICSLILYSCSTNNDNASASTFTLAKNQIIRYESSNDFIKSTFPDTLISGDILNAEIYSSTDEWKVIEAYVNCQIESDGIFRVRKRFKLECLELPIRENKAQIEFETVGNGPKKFLPVTLIIENVKGIKKAIELPITTYYLKKGNGS